MNQDRFPPAICIVSACAIAVTAFIITMAGFSLNPAIGLMLAKAGIAYLVISASVRQLSRHWLIAAAIGALDGGIVYFCLVAYWIIFPPAS